MDRKIRFGVTVMFFLTVVFHANAQTPAKIPTVGFLGARSAASGTGLERLRRELTAIGYIEGKTIAFESRYADNKPERLPGLADELVRLKIDVLVAAAIFEALAAKKAVRTIPIVFVISGDPVVAGLVDSFARPGGNLTGFTQMEVLAGKRLEILKETLSKPSRVAVLWNPQDPGSSQQWNESQLAAKVLGLELHSMAVAHTDEFDTAFKEAVRARSAALAVTTSPLFGRLSISQWSLKYKLPTIHSASISVEEGALMSYGADRTESYTRVAAMVDKILKGAKPAEIPVEQPMKFEFVINLKTAQQINLTIPPEVLARANRIIR